VSVRADAIFPRSRRAVKDRGVVFMSTSDQNP